MTDKSVVPEGMKLDRLARFIGEQTEREAIVDWLRKVADSKPHGTDWRTYYEIADAIEIETHVASNPLSLETSDLDPIAPEEDALATKAIVAMGWTRQAYDSAVRMVRVVVAEIAQRQASERLALEAIKAVTATTKDGPAGLSRIMCIARAAGVEAPYSELLEDPRVALIVNRPRVEWMHLFGPVCTIPPEGWRCTRTPSHDGPCAAHSIQSGGEGGAS